MMDRRQITKRCSSQSCECAILQVTRDDLHEEDSTIVNPFLTVNCGLEVDPMSGKY
jgi:hypothetical protein